MGRHAGWIALYAGLAGGANVILIPEQPFDLERVCDYIEQPLRAASTRRSSSSPRAPSPKGGMPVIAGDAPTDAFGHVRLGGIGHWLEGEIEGRTGHEARATVLGHVQRGGTPTAFDRVLATRFGLHAIDAAHDGRVGEDDRRCGRPRSSSSTSPRRPPSSRSSPTRSTARPRSSSVSRRDAIAPPRSLRRRRAAVLAGCGGGEDGGGEPTLTVYVSLPLSGPAAPTAAMRPTAPGSRSPTPAARPAGWRSRRGVPRRRRRRRGRLDAGRPRRQRPRRDPGLDRDRLPRRLRVRRDPGLAADHQRAPACSRSPRRARADDLVAGSPGSDEVPTPQPTASGPSAA